MDNFSQDFRYALRMLIKRPAFTFMAVVALALGIGANTAIFSVVNAVLLRPLPFDEPERLVWVWDTQPQLEQAPASMGDFLAWREQNQSFSSMAAYQSGNMFLDQGEGARQAEVGLVTPDFFATFRQTPQLGRTFTEDETAPGKFRVAILSDRLWREGFGADPDVTSKTLKLNGYNYEIIGVMAAGFDYPGNVEMWRPLPIDPAEVNHNSHYLRVVGRLKPGVSIESAQADMLVLAARLSEEHKHVNAGHSVKLEPLHEVMVGNVRLMLYVLLGAVAFVLLIACANVANLLLARSATRRREVALRTALGAGRGRIIRQLLTESLVLALLGGAAGLLLAYWGVGALTSFIGQDLPRAETIGLAPGVLLFTLAVSIVTGALFGLAPALQLSKTDLNESLKEGGRGSSGTRGRLRGVFIIAEVALALVLLAGAGLMIKSFIRLNEVEPGFNPDRVLTMGVLFLRTTHPTDENVAAIYRQLLDRLSATPGVEVMGAINDVPMSGSNTNDSFVIEGAPPLPKEQHPLTEYRVVTPSYFKAMQIPLLAGRDLEWTDTKESPNVTVINETFARRHFPGESPLGRRIILQGQQRDPLQIVGVVGDVKHFGLDQKEPVAECYVPYLQDPLSQELSRYMTLVARTQSDPGSLAGALRDEALRLDKTLPIFGVRTMRDQLRESLTRRRFNMMLLVIFAAVALLLAAVGIYGVISYSVTERTHEIGIRQALGARPRDILKMVMGQGLVLALAGIAAGLVAAYIVTRFAESLLYGVSATDPATFLVISAVVLGVALAACFIPARRATKTDPTVALRYE